MGKRRKYVGSNLNGGGRCSDKETRLGANKFSILSLILPLLSGEQWGKHNDIYDGEFHLKQILWVLLFSRRVYCKSTGGHPGNPRKYKASN